MNATRAAYLAAEGFTFTAVAVLTPGGTLTLAVDAGVFKEGFTFAAKEKVAEWTVTGVPYDDASLLDTAGSLLSPAFEWLDHFITEEDGELVALFLGLALTASDSEGVE